MERPLARRQVRGMNERTRRGRVMAGAVRRGPWPRGAVRDPHGSHHHGYGQPVACHAACSLGMASGGVGAGIAPLAHTFVGVGGAAQQGEVRHLLEEGGHP